MLTPIHLIYLDAHHLDDPLYVATMARLMARRTAAWPPSLILHGGGDRAARLFEAEGLFPKIEDGRIQVRTPHEAALVERALRQVNRRIVGMLTDEVVHAVGFQGTDRGLLRVAEGGVVQGGRLGWVRDLVRQRVVPVLAALADDEATGGACEVPLAAAALAVAQALPDDEVVVVFFTRTGAPGLVEDETPVPERPLDAVPDGLVTDSAALRQVLQAGVPALLTSAVGLFGGHSVQGTRIYMPKSA